MKFFDMFKKPKDFFPHKLQACGTGIDVRKELDTLPCFLFPKLRTLCAAFWKSLKSLKFAVNDSSKSRMLRDALRIVTALRRDICKAQFFSICFFCKCRVSCHTCCHVNAGRQPFDSTPPEGGI